MIIFIKVFKSSNYLQHLLKYLNFHPQQHQIKQFFHNYLLYLNLVYMSTIFENFIITHQGQYLVLFFLNYFFLFISKPLSRKKSYHYSIRFSQASSKTVFENLSSRFKFAPFLVKILIASIFFLLIKKKMNWPFHLFI